MPTGARLLTGTVVNGLQRSKLGVLVAEFTPVAQIYDDSLVTYFDYSANLYVHAITPDPHCDWPLSESPTGRPEDNAQDFRFTLSLFGSDTRPPIADLYYVRVTGQTSGAIFDIAPYFDQLLTSCPLSGTLAQDGRGGDHFDGPGGGMWSYSSQAREATEAPSNEVLTVFLRSNDAPNEGVAAPLKPSGFINGETATITDTRF